MIVRSFRLSDYAEVNELLTEVFSEEYYEETVDAYSRQLSLDTHLVMVAESRQKVVGVIIGTVDVDNNGYYYRLAVDRNHQRKGIGKSMIQALKRRFQMRKVKNILVTSDDHNAPVLPLYKSLGYEVSDAKLRIVGE